MTTKPTIRSKRTKKAKGVVVNVSKRRLREDRERVVLENIKARLPELEHLLDRACEHLRDPEDAHLVGHPSSSIHRRWRALILEMFNALQGLMPDRPITGPFRTLVAQATEGDYDLSAKAIKARGSRLSEALTYAFFCLAAACRRGREKEIPPDRSDGDWSKLIKMFGRRQGKGGQGAKTRP